MNNLLNLAVFTLTVTSVCVSVKSQVINIPSPSRQSKALKCTFPKVEVVSRQLFQADGQIVESPVSLTEYTRCDEQLREVESGESLDGDPDVKTVSRYDEHGNEIEHAFYTHNSLTHRSVSRYDNANRIIKTAHNDGSQTSCTNQKTKSSCKLITSDGRIQKRWIVTLDAFGREIQKIEFERGRGLNHRYVYGYDGSGNRNLEVDYYHTDGGDKTSRTFLTFDKEGKLLEKLWYDETGLRTREVIDYNSKGDLIRRTEYDSSNLVNERVTMEYQSYDMRGNWSKAIEIRILSRKGNNRMEIRRILYRAITYSRTTMAFAGNGLEG